LNELKLIKDILLIILKLIISLIYCIMLIGGGFFLIIFVLICIYGKTLYLDNTPYIILMISSGVIGISIDYLMTKLKLRK